jgi:predicted HicB family RNase H-like nuclease
MKQKRTPAQLAADLERTGRPPKPAKLRYSEQLTVKMTRDERRRLEAAAQREGLSLPGLLMRPWRKGE